ncbi:MAG: LptF/LptG family permease, partial [Acidobacteriota bacterium]
MLKILDKYILKEVFPPFLVGLLVTAFVLLMNQVLLLAELFIDRGVPAGVAARLFVYLVPSLLAFAVPMAVLTGILGGLARLSADSEIVAFRSLGVGAGRIARPLVLFGLAGWLVTSALTLVLAPRANFLWVREMTSSVLARASLRINPLEFSETIPKTVLFVENVDESKQWQNVFAYLNKDPRAPRVVMARTGRIHFFPGDKRATLELEDGVLHSGTLAKPETYSVTSFERFEEEIDVESLFPTVAREKRVREKDILELVRDAKVLGGEVAALNASGQADAPSTRASAIRKRRDLRTHWVEIHKKFSLPFVCFVFVLLGLPLGLMTGRGGRTGGLSLSLAIIFLYYVLITAGEKLAIDGRTTPFLAMWGPDILLTAAGIALFFRSERDTDALARLTASLRKRAAALFRFRPRPRVRRSFRPPFGLPGILDRYIARKYLAIMAFATTALLGASVIVAFFERLDEVHRHGQPVGLLVHHIWFRIPEFLSSVLPAAALTTTLLVLGLLVRTNE